MPCMHQADGCLFQPLATRMSGKFQSRRIAMDGVVLWREPRQSMFLADCRVEDLDADMIVE